MTAAARGVLALIVGNRQAADHFDFSQRGLVGSFIALLAVILLETTLPIMFGATAAGGSVFRTVASVAILLAFGIGTAAIVLRRFNRPDGLVPYIITINWANFYVTVAVDLLILVGFPADILIIAMLITGLVLQINIGRLIVTLSPLQIAIFLIAQLVGISIGLLFVGMLLPISPAELEAIGLSTQPA